MIMMISNLLPVRHCFAAVAVGILLLVVTLDESVAAEVKAAAANDRGACRLSTLRCLFSSLFGQCLTHAMIRVALDCVPFFAAVTAAADGGWGGDAGAAKLSDAVPPSGRAVGSAVGAEPGAAAAATTTSNSSIRIGSRDLPATTVQLDFEGLADGQQVGNFYNGGSGGLDYGIVFGASFVASVSRDAGGTGRFPTAPSPNTTLTFDPSDYDRDFMTVDAGFTGITFKYSVRDELGIVLYDGPNKTGNFLLRGETPRRHSEWAAFEFQVPPGSAAARSLSFFVPGTVPFIDDVAVTLVSLPRNPTNAPTKPPTKFPTLEPTAIPTDDPSKPPTRLPTKPPTGMSSCNGTTYWVYNAAATNAPFQKLVNNSVTCLAHPYSIEIRPCINGIPVPIDVPVTMKLVRTHPGGRRAAVHRHVNPSAPYFLFGSTAATGDVLPSPAQLPNGNYQLLASIVGGDYKVTVAFSQSCPPCPKGRKGRKGCMQKDRALSDKTK